MTVLEPHKFSGPHVGGNLSRARLRMECRGPSGRVLGRGAFKFTTKSSLYNASSSRSARCALRSARRVCPWRRLTGFARTHAMSKRAKDGNSSEGEGVQLQLYRSRGRVCADSAMCGGSENRCARPRAQRSYRRPRVVLPGRRWAGNASGYL